MKILHGLNQIQSREQFIRLKQAATAQGANPVEFDGQKVTVGELSAALNTTSLFGQPGNVFIEQFFARRPGKDKTAVISFLEKLPASPVTVWEDTDVSGQLKDFPPACVSRFDLPKYIFQFLDTLEPAALGKALQYAPAEQVFSLLCGAVRKLIAVKLKRTDLPAWQLAKSAPLAARYSQTQLFYAYRRLLDMDYRQKNSASVMDLSAALELWVAVLNQKS